MDAKPPENDSPAIPAGVEAGGNLSDAELWRSLQQGDRAAFGALYDRYAAVVYTIALRTLGNVQDAEDLTQEVFLQLARSSYDPQRGTLRTFLAVLTRSRGLDRLRAGQRARQSLTTWQAEQQAAIANPPDLLAESLDRADSVQQVQSALAQLSDNQRQVLQLAYSDGLSQSAIAERLGIPLGTVKAWARRGLLKLRQTLQSAAEDA
jgi:RNA polymerase sigma-70 factor (ECF subfamily)